MKQMQINSHELTPYNIHKIVEKVVENVETIKSGKNSKSEQYLYCGGGYDTESTTITDIEGKPQFAFVYHIQMHINGNYIYFRHIDLITPFFKRLVQHIKYKYWIKKQHPHLIIWIANLAHEWSFFKRQLHHVGITDLFAKTDRNPLKITVGECVEFRECIGLFGKSLANIAENYTETQKLKGDLDYKLIRTPQTPLTEQEKKYCFNDTKILDELSLVAFEKFTKKGLKIPLTNTGILRQECKKAINNIKCEYSANFKLMPESEKIYGIFRRYLYNGGLCGSNVKYVGKLLHNVKCADITSDYPAQINHELYPSGELKECEPCEIEKHKHQFRIYILLIDKMKSTTSHSVFSKYKVMNFNETKNTILNNGKIFYSENVMITVNNVDMQALEKAYTFEGIKILRCWYFTHKSKAPKFLLTLMNYYYKNKNELKKQGFTDCIEYIESKIKVNCFYGMSATKLYDCIYKYNETTKEISKNDNEKTYSEQIKSIWLNPFIAFWCTSYARKILIDLIVKYPELIVQYDTDSIYFLTDLNIVKRERVEELENDLKHYNIIKKIQNKNIFNDEDFYTLGAWDIDEPVKNFKCLGAKRYIYEKYDGTIKPVVAGLPKQAFKDYVKKNNLNPFELFDNNMKINKVDCKKLASKYYDGDIKEYLITDYQGNNCVVEVGTYHALFEIDFTLKLSSDYERLIHIINDEKALPSEMRYITNLIENVSHETIMR